MDDRDISVARARLDEVLVEPARAGARRVAFGAGRVASWIAAALGASAAILGATLMALTQVQALDIAGAMVLALGAGVFGSGTAAALLVGRAERRLEASAVERRLVKLLSASGAVSDVEAATRTGADVREIRAVAARLVRTGLLDLDIDDASGREVYRLGRLLSDDAAELRAFDERLLGSAGELTHEVSGVERRAGGALYEAVPAQAGAGAEHAEYEALARPHVVDEAGRS